MSKIKMVDLQCRTFEAIVAFFNDIKQLSQEDSSIYQMQLYARVKRFFDVMNQFGRQEFSKMLEKHQFEHTDAVQQGKYTDAFTCLVALIVAEYDESDLLRYFLPKKYSIEDKPTHKSDSTWMAFKYWVQFVAYWLGSKLFNRQKFKMVGLEGGMLKLAINGIKQDLSKNNYYDLCLKSRSFNENVKIMLGKFVEKRARINNAANINGTAPLPPLLAKVPPLSPAKTVQSTLFATTLKPNNVKGNDEDLLKQIRAGIKLKPVSKEGKLSKESSGNDGDLLKQIRAGIKLKPVSKEGELSKESSGNDGDLLKQIRAGIKLKPVSKEGKLSRERTNDDAELLKQIRAGIKLKPINKHEKLSNNARINVGTSKAVASNARIQMSI